MKSVIQTGLRRSRKADRMAWILLIALAAVLVISLAAGVSALGLA